MDRHCQLVLDDPHVPWFHSRPEDGRPSIQGRGYAFIGQTFVQGQTPVDVVAERVARPSVEASVSSLRQLIPRLNGAWALVAQWPQGRVLAATDRLRSVPLFYAAIGEGLVLSSSIYPFPRGWERRGSARRRRSISCSAAT